MTSNNDDTSWSADVQEAQRELTRGSSGTKLRKPSAQAAGSVHDVPVLASGLAGAGLEIGDELGGPTHSMQIFERFLPLIDMCGPFNAVLLRPPSHPNGPEKLTYFFAHRGSRLAILKKFTPYRRPPALIQVKGRFCCQMAGAAAVLASALVPGVRRHATRPRLP
jgi:hypothetical protein